MTSSLRRPNPISRTLVTALALAFAVTTCGAQPSSDPGELRGARTSDEAARSRSADQDSVPLSLAGWRPAPGFAASTASSDTTEVELPPEVEVQRSEHLYRDIAMFVVISAFVGYFIVKVFLEDDTDEPPPAKNGKDIPGPS